MRLRIAGSEDLDPGYARTIRSLVRRLRLEDSVEFMGVIGEEELVHCLQGVDAFVFPNSPQTWGLAVFEAMACGTPVIVSNGCGAAEVLTDGMNALIVPPCRPDLIADNLVRLAEDEDLYRSLSVNGRHFVAENISWDKYADVMVSHFIDVAHRSER